MKNFFNNELLLDSSVSEKLYLKVKNLPIIDYHCHLEEKLISENKSFSDIGELWLSFDHYKWRAMRLCGIDEEYITGKKTFKEKFFAYAKIMPKLAGNPLYYWTHLELKQLFGIDEPLNENTAEIIYNKANEIISGLSIRKILKKFNVEFIATTDDPLSELTYHGNYDGVSVSPTFRPDKVFKNDKEYIEKLKEMGKDNDIKKALSNRLDYFISKGCKIADTALDFIPDENTEQYDLLCYLAELYSQKHIIMQLHLGTFRNVNTSKFLGIGADSGFDIMRSEVDTDRLVKFLNKLNEKNQLPITIIYTLNDNAIKNICTLSGAFKNVYVGAAWWFNDTVNGIKKHISNVAEYSSLGTNLGMLTDSRSFSSYPRFDFFRRILCSFVGDLVENGEYDEKSAEKLVKDICYNNIKELLSI